MKKVIGSIIGLACAVSMAVAVDVGSLDINTAAKFGANYVIGVNPADWASQTGSNSAVTLTNVMLIKVGEAVEFKGFILDIPLQMTAAHTNGGVLGALDLWTNSIALTVTSSNATSILASTEICNESTYVATKLPYATTTITYLSAASGMTSYATNGLVSVTTNTVIVPVITAGANKYYTSQDYINITLTPNDTPNALSAMKKGAFRLLFRKYSKLNN